METNRLVKGMTRMWARASENRLFHSLCAVKPARLLVALGVITLLATAGLTQPPTPPIQGSGPGESLGGGVSPSIDAFPRAAAAGGMIGFSHGDGSGTQTITLVDTEKSWMAVYHVDRSGKIRLVSSRPIDADFSLQLNATAPLPEEIRQLGGR